MSDVLADLTAQGVAVWLDDLSRERLTNGSLERLVRDKHVVGVTTNPTIFQKALEKGSSYDDQVHDLALRGVNAEEAVRTITTYDVRWACDVMRAAFDGSHGLGGRVSIEVDPRLAQDRHRTTAEAKALWWLVDRPNAFIKIPATEASLPSIVDTLGEGISVNVTLIFSLARYDQVMEAYLSGLEKAKANGHDLSTIASVASFFVSRVDTEVDARLDKIGTDEAKELRGQAAIANARLAYEHYSKIFTGDRWQALVDAGAKPQRPLWASTGVKDPSYDDTRYVVELVAPGVVNTMPETTLQAVDAHGEVRGDTVTDGYAEAKQTLDRLEAIGISYDEVVDALEREGVEKFEASWAQLLESVQAQLDSARLAKAPA
jgi:transaldolase